MTESTIITVPLSYLVPSPRNVRKTGGMSINELAASIYAHGLLQNLNVAATEGHTYEVLAGGRRLRALQQLARDGIIADDYPVPCMLQPAERAREASLAENTVREAMHPADQFEAFQALAEDGRGVADIAASFGVSEMVVRQRLKLAMVAPELLDDYRAGKLSLEALEAFTLTNDHDAQLRVWKEAVHPWQREAREIRGKLTGKEVNATCDRHARLVGVAAYESAGGQSRTDLFGGDVYLADPALLHKLADDILQDAAKRLRAEGWKWVEVATDGAETWRYEKKRGKHQPLTAEEDRELDVVRAQIEEGQRALQQFEASELDDTALDQADVLRYELADLTTKADELARGTETWSSKAKAIAGAIVELSPGGALVIHRGLVKPVDAKRAAREAAAKAKGDAAPTTGDDALSESLLRHLTAHRTAVMQSQLLGHPQVALAVLAYHLLQSAFGVRWYTHLGQMTLSPNDRALDRDGVAADYPPREALFQQIETWRGDIPDDPAAAMRTLLDLPPDQLQDLLALCTAVAFDATHGRLGEHDQRPALIDMLCGAMGIDMADYWKATAESYLGRVSKPLIRAAVLEAGFTRRVADELMDLKKSVAAAEAENILIPTRWLPTPLRRLEPQPAKKVRKARKA